MVFVMAAHADKYTYILFTYWYNQYLLSAYCVPGTITGTAVVVVQK